RAREMQLLGDRDEIAEVTQFHGRKIMRFWLTKKQSTLNDSRRLSQHSRLHTGFAVRLHFPDADNEGGFLGSGHCWRDTRHGQQEQLTAWQCRSISPPRAQERRS